MNKTATAASILAIALAMATGAGGAEGVAPATIEILDGNSYLRGFMVYRTPVRIDAQGAIAVSLFTGFPHADIHNAGLSVVVVADGDEAQARAWRDELLEQAWRSRAEFVYRLEPLAESLERARAAAAAAGDGPVILLDHYDNTASGGTMT